MAQFFRQVSPKNCDYLAYTCCQKTKIAWIFMGCLPIDVLCDIFENIQNSPGVYIPIVIAE